MNNKSVCIPHYKIFTVAEGYCSGEVNSLRSSKVKILFAVGFLFVTFSLPTKEKVIYEQRI